MTSLLQKPTVAVMPPQHTEVDMNPKMYEGLGAQHQAALHREAAGGHLVARSRDGRPTADEAPRLHAARWADRVAALRRGLGLDVTRPRRDLGPTRRPELRQDVLHVAARRLRRDTQ
jgi:hypothetical protein